MAVSIRVGQEIKDAARDLALGADDFRIIRVWNADVEANLEGVFDQIL